MVSPMTMLRWSGERAMWCGSRRSGMRRTSWWVAMSSRLTLASLELMTKARSAARAWEKSAAARVRAREQASRQRSVMSAA